MATAAHTTKVTVSTTAGGTYTEINGLIDASRSRSIDTGDTTDYADTSGEHTRIVLLGDGGMELSGDYEQSDTLGQTLIRNGALNKTTVFIRHLPDGTNGQMAEYIITSYEESGPVDGKNSFKASLQKTGAYTTV